MGMVVKEDMVSVAALRSIEGVLQVCAVLVSAALQLARCFRFAANKRNAILDALKRG